MDALKNLVLGLLPWLVAALVVAAGAALVALAGWVRARWQGSRVALVVARALELADAVVRDVGAGMRPQLVAATADGKITPDEARALKLAALERLKVSLSERGVEELRAALRLTAPGMEIYLSGLLERALVGAKATAPETRAIAAAKAAAFPLTPPVR